MKIMFRAMMVAASLMLGGCNGTIDPATLTAIQNAVSAQCAFLPTEIQIAALFPQYNSITTPAAAVATIICAAVTAQVPKSTRLALRSAARSGNLYALTPVTVKVRFNGTRATVTGVFIR